MEKKVVIVSGVAERKDAGLFYRQTRLFIGRRGLFPD